MLVVLLAGLLAPPGPLPDGMVRSEISAAFDGAAWSLLRCSRRPREVVILELQGGVDVSFDGDVDKAVAACIVDVVHRLRWSRSLARTTIRYPIRVGLGRPEHETVEVGHAVELAQGAFDDCGQRARVDVRWRVDGDRAVDVVVGVGSPPIDDATRACVVDVVSHWRFSSALTGTTQWADVDLRAR